jgi:serine/threonine protein kinase
VGITLGNSHLQASNILVGRDGTVRLSDLGVAAKLERHLSCSSEFFAKLERRNTFVGSPAFIAPELLTGVEEGWAAPQLLLVRLCG